MIRFTLDVFFDEPNNAFSGLSLIFVTFFEVIDEMIKPREAFLSIIALVTDYFRAFGNNLHRKYIFDLIAEVACLFLDVAGDEFVVPTFVENGHITRRVFLLLLILALHYGKVA